MTSLVVYFVDEDTHPNVVKYVDPLVAIATIIIVIVASIPIIKRSCAILLQTIPDHLVGATNSNFYSSGRLFRAQTYDCKIWKSRSNNLLSLIATLNQLCYLGTVTLPFEISLNSINIIES